MITEPQWGQLTYWESSILDTEVFTSFNILVVIFWLLTIAVSTCSLETKRLFDSCSGLIIVGIGSIEMIVSSSGIIDELILGIELLL